MTASALLLCPVPAESTMSRNLIAVEDAAYSLKKNLGELVDHLDDMLGASMDGDTQKVREIWREVKQTPGKIVVDAFPVLRYSVAAMSRLQLAEKRIETFLSDARAALAIASDERNFYQTETGIVNRTRLPIAKSPGSTVSAFHQAAEPNGEEDEDLPYRRARGTNPVGEYALRCANVTGISRYAVFYSYWKGLMEKYAGECPVNDPYFDQVYGKQAGSDPARQDASDPNPWKRVDDDEFAASERQSNQWDSLYDDTGKPHGESGPSWGGTDARARQFGVVLETDAGHQNAQDPYATELARLGASPLSASPGGDYQAALAALNRRNRAQAQRERMRAESADPGGESRVAGAEQNPEETSERRDAAASAASPDAGSCDRANRKGEAAIREIQGKVGVYASAAQNTCASVNTARVALWVNRECLGDPKWSSSQRAKIRAQIAVLENNLAQGTRAYRSLTSAGASCECWTDICDERH